MCGIGGVFNRDGEPVPPERLLGMSALLTHRGPDEEGYLLDGNAGFCHRRLSIIDVAGGRQPVTNEDGNVATVYNGEIYNFKELRSGLLARGHVFATETDTEVLTHLYEEKGTDFLEELNGIFAFAIWDRKKRALFLARDKYGAKPLYLYQDPRKVVFSSEVKPVLAGANLAPRLNPSSAAEYFTFQNTFDSRTFFDSVELIPPGHAVVVDASHCRRFSYWDLSFDEEAFRDRSEDNLVETLEHHFSTAVKRQLMSDVPVGSYLSSGLDSTAIALIGAQNLKPFFTFTCGYDMRTAEAKDRACDERFFAEETARCLATYHAETTITPETLWETLEETVWRLEEPRVGVSYQQLPLSKLARQTVKVVLSGTGADELFGGYPWRYEGLDDYETEDDFLREYHRRWIRFIPDERKRRFFSPDFLKRIEGFSSFDSFLSVMSRCGAASRQNRALYFDFKTFLHGMLIVEDRLSMANSIELRVPFLDDDLVRFARRLPVSLKFRPGESKYLLRKSLGKFLPPWLLSRRKYGFTPPDFTWFRNFTVDRVRDLLLAPRTLERNLFRKEFVESLLEQLVVEGQDHRFLIWSLMFCEVWHRLFIDGDRFSQARVDAVGRAKAQELQDKNLFNCFSAPATTLSTEGSVL